MHIHTTMASPSGDALAGAQAAETAMAMRRARQLHDAATRLKAGNLNITPDGSQDPDTLAQTVSMIGAWAGRNAESRQAEARRAEMRRAAQDSGNPPPSALVEPGTQEAPVRVQEARRISATAPVSYWA